MGTPAAKFTPEAANNIKKAAKLVLGEPDDRTGRSAKTRTFPNGIFWANLTGCSAAKYSWTEQREKGDGTFEDLPSGRTGTTSTNYAVNERESDEPGVPATGTVRMVQTFDSTGKPYYRFSIRPALGTTIRVNLAPDGGADGTQTTTPTYTYTATTLDGSTTLAGSLTPDWPRSPGEFAAASGGIGYWDIHGAFKLAIAFEAPGTVPCNIPAS